ncbi:LLM class flavin-dependent oxidoreductase [Microbacterium sp. LWH7-1.2]|uniref:LLM class flavin-dependent oxidoreductase n=1 Tax=Microbacterium sp. LWH7-1.2 TaxID=3135257 RepID=UPI00313A09CF
MTAGRTTARVSVNLPATALRDIGTVAQAAESAGFSALRVGDMQSTARELYTTLTMIAAATTSILFGPGVTNPVTRHPTVTASAIASLHEFSGGRAVLGIGTGDSALRNSGARSTTLAELEECILAIRSMHETGRAEYRGETARLQWWSGGRIPILMSAHGPRSLQAAGRVADGVVVGLGVGERSREFAAEHIALGARSVGRDPSEIEVWHYVCLDVAESGDLAADASGSVLAVAGNLLVKGGGRSVIPDSLRGAFTELAQRYSYVHHADGELENPNAALIKELGLRDYLLEQFGVMGRPDEVRDRLRTLVADGVSNLWGGYAQPDLVGFFDRWRAGVADDAASTLSGADGDQQVRPAARESRS